MPEKTKKKISMENTMYVVNHNAQAHILRQIKVAEEAVSVEACAKATEKFQKNSVYCMMPGYDYRDDDTDPSEEG